MRLLSRQDGGPGAEPPRPGKAAARARLATPSESKSLGLALARRGQVQRATPDRAVCGLPREDQRPDRVLAGRWSTCAWKHGRWPPGRLSAGRSKGRLDRLKQVGEQGGGARAPAGLQQVS